MSAYLDTRDLDSELDELQDRADDDSGEDGSPIDPLDDDEQERLAALIALRDQIGSEWEHGVTLIPDSEFEDYAQELAFDIGMVERDSQIANYIDWSRWADDVKSDYSCVEFDDETYYYRG